MYSDEPPTSPFTQLLRSTEPQSLMSPAWQQDEMRQRAASWRIDSKQCFQFVSRSSRMGTALIAPPPPPQCCLPFLPPVASSWIDTAYVYFCLILSFFSVLSHPRLSLVLFAVSVRHGKIAAQLGWWWPPTRIGKASFRVLCHFAVTSNTRPRIRSSNLYKCRLSHIAIGRYTIG